MTKSDISRTKSYLDRCQIAGPGVIKHWNDVEFRVLSEDWDTETARLFIQKDDKPVIFLYPCLSRYTPDYQSFCVLKEFGKYILLQAPEEMETHWKQKLVLPTNAQIDAFTGRLNEGFKSYSDVVESLKLPVDRLVALHLANALMKNGQAFNGASNVDVREWGPTHEFATCQRYFSISPLTSAYCPQHVNQDFGSAFASMCVYDFKTVRHTQIKEFLVQIVERIINQAR